MVEGSHHIYHIDVKIPSRFFLWKPERWKGIDVINCKYMISRFLTVSLAVRHKFGNETDKAVFRIRIDYIRIRIQHFRRMRIWIRIQCGSGFW
jgi:hypothetical protein